VIDTAAFLDRLVPGIRANQIFRPKRPDSALARPNRVNQAFLVAAAFLQKYAISCTRLLNNGCPQPHALKVPLSYLPRRNFQQIRDEPYFRLSHPDISLTGPGAAPATLLTLKMQTTTIPRDFLTFRHLVYHFRMAPVSALVAIEAYFAR